MAAVLAAPQIAQVASQAMETASSAAPWVIAFIFLLIGIVIIIIGGFKLSNANKNKDTLGPA